MLKLLGKALSKFKYLIALTIFAIFTVFVGDHCWLKRLQQKNEISDLQDKIAALDQQYVEDSLQILALDTDIDAVRKIARERYYMKNAGEDVFLIQDEEEGEEE